MLTIHMSGIMYFDGCRADYKQALVPDGTGGYKGTDKIPRDIPPHYASIWVELGDVDWRYLNWWPEQVVFHTLTFDEGYGDKTAYVAEFRIPQPARLLTFPDEEDEPAQCIGFDKWLPQLQYIDPQFHIDLERPDVIARVKIRGGRLAVYGFNKVGAPERRVASVKWRINRVSRRREIRADGYSIPLVDRDRQEVVFSNNADLLTDGALHQHDALDQDPNNHFFLYEKLEKYRDGSRLEIPPYNPDLDALRFEHAYLKMLFYTRPFPDAGCTPTCC